MYRCKIIVPVENLLVTGYHVLILLRSYNAITITVTAVNFDALHADGSLNNITLRGYFQHHKLFILIYTQPPSKRNILILHIVRTKTLSFADDNKKISYRFKITFFIDSTSAAIRKNNRQPTMMQTLVRIKAVSSIYYILLYGSFQKANAVKTVGDRGLKLK